MSNPSHPPPPHHHQFVQYSSKMGISHNRSHCVPMGSREAPMSNPSPSTWENTRHADDGGHDNNNVDNDDDYRRDGDHEVIPVYIHGDNDHNDDGGDAKDD